MQTSLRDLWEMHRHTAKERTTRTYCGIYVILKTLIEKSYEMQRTYCRSVTISHHTELLADSHKDVKLDARLGYQKVVTIPLSWRSASASSRTRCEMTLVDEKAVI
jgi:hypothetical protein